MTTSASFVLDRMEIEDVGLNPDKLAHAIHSQLGLTTGPVPIHEIAKALDIDEIREEPLANFEGMLLTTPGRSYGKILINSTSHVARRRFSVAHELGHFLNPMHKQVFDGGFRCSTANMQQFASGKLQHDRQEYEANRFAISVLAPPHLMRKFLTPDAEIEMIVNCAAGLNLSKAAAARRFIELHDDTLAVVFAHEGRVKYSITGQDFPRMSLHKGDPLPLPLTGISIGKTTDMDRVDEIDWILKPCQDEVFAQTLVQQDGHSMTLLSVARADENE